MTDDIVPTPIEDGLVIVDAVVGSRNSSVLLWRIELVNMRTVDKVAGISAPNGDAVGAEELQLGAKVQSQGPLRLLGDDFQAFALDAVASFRTLSEPYGLVAG